MIFDPNQWFGAMFIGAFLVLASLFYHAIFDNEGE